MILGTLIETESKKYAQTTHVDRKCPDIYPGLINRTMDLSKNSSNTSTQSSGTSV